MINIKVSDDFTKSPGGRYKEEGNYSGEEFRDLILFPKYCQAKKENDKLTIDLDGCYGFPTSFIEEAFGGLARKLKDENIIEHLEFISNDEPGLINDIQEYIKNANNK